jgi:hypothetical protein
MGTCIFETLNKWREYVAKTGEIHAQLGSSPIEPWTKSI